LTYPLCPVPLSLAFPDGTKRSTTKSKLLAIIAPKENLVDVSEERSCKTLVVDLHRDFSIKAAEREKRGASQKILIKSWKTRLPREMAKFYVNSENKNQLIALTFYLL